jgi:hypothetical protein
MSEQAVNATASAAGTIYDSCWWFWYMPGCYSYYSKLFNDIPPYLWSAIGIVVAIGVSVLGAAWGIFITGACRSDLDPCAEFMVVCSRRNGCLSNVHFDMNRGFFCFRRLPQRRHFFAFRRHQTPANQLEKPRLGHLRGSMRDLWCDHGDYSPGQGRGARSGSCFCICWVRNIRRWYYCRILEPLLRSLSWSRRLVLRALRCPESCHVCQDPHHRDFCVRARFIWRHHWHHYGLASYGLMSRNFRTPNSRDYVSLSL